MVLLLLFVRPLAFRLWPVRCLCLHMRPAAAWAAAVPPVVLRSGTGGIPCPFAQHLLMVRHRITHSSSRLVIMLHPPFLTTLAFLGSGHESSNPARRCPGPHTLQAV